MCYLKKSNLITLLVTLYPQLLIAEHRKILLTMKISFMPSLQLFNMRRHHRINIYINVVTL